MVNKNLLSTSRLFDAVRNNPAAWIAFLVSSIFFILFSLFSSYNRTVQALAIEQTQVLGNLTQTSFAIGQLIATHTQTPDPVEQRTKDEFFVEMIQILNSEPERVLNVLSGRIDQFDNDFDRGRAHVLIGSAENYFYKTLFTEEESQHLPQAKELLLFIAENSPSLNERAQSYAYLTVAHLYSGEVNIAETYQSILLTEIYPEFSGGDNAPDLIGAYPHLIAIGWLYSSLDHVEQLNMLVIDTLPSWLDQLPPLEQRIGGFKILAEAYLSFGGYQFASAVYQNLVDIDPSTENIVLLANAYYAAGNNLCAYLYYRELAESNEHELSEEEAVLVREAISHIQTTYNGEVPPC